MHSFLDFYEFCIQKVIVIRLREGGCFGTEKQEYILGSVANFFTDKKLG